MVDLGWDTIATRGGDRNNEHQARECYKQIILMLGRYMESTWRMMKALAIAACSRCSVNVCCMFFGAADYLTSCVNASGLVQHCTQERCHALCACQGCVYLDDFLLGAWQLDVAPVKALTLSGCTPQAVSLPGASLLMHCNHAGPHEEDAHIHVSTCICSSTGRSCSIM